MKIHPIQKLSEELAVGFKREPHWSWDVAADRMQRLQNRGQRKVGATTYTPSEAKIAEMQAALGVGRSEAITILRMAKR